MTAIVLAGLLIGLGITMLVAALVPAAPDLGAALARLERSQQPRPHRPTGGPSMHPIVAPALERLTRTLRLERHAADLALTGTSLARLAGEKVGYALVGLVFPVLMTAILVIGGVSLPLAVPALAGVVLAAAMSLLPDHELRRRASLARVQMRRTVCTYLELVALERAADAGAVEALERAAAIGQGPGFGHIREALLRARLEGRTPWDQLSRLATDLRVPELGDVADIMRLSGEDGAAVLATLRARAASLRTSLLQADVAAANEASERMSIPVALLGVAFMVLLGFPAFARILFG